MFDPIIVRYFKKYKRSILLGCFLIFILSAMLLPTPLITKYIFDDILPQKKNNELKILIYIVFTILIIQKLLAFLQSYHFLKIGTKIIFDIRLEILKKINDIPLEIKNKYGKGYLLSRINSDTERIKSIFTDTIALCIKDILTLSVGLSAIFYLNLKLAIFLCVLMPFYVVGTIYFNKLLKTSSRNYYEADALTLEQLNETLSMVELVKEFSRRNFNLIRYVNVYKKSYKMYVKYARISLINTLTIGFIGSLAPILIVSYGIFAIIEGTLTIGSLIAFNTFSAYLFGPVSRLLEVNINFQKSLVALKRIKELLDIPDQNCKCSLLIHKIKSLELNNISFGYKSGSKVISNLNIRIESGNRFGIVGPSGSGKSTLIKLVSGLYKINQGSYLINNTIIENNMMSTTRKYIAVVEQEPFLFNDTIYNNIAFGRAGATMDEVHAAAKAAHVDDFVKDLPNRYNTATGINGNQLSVGQKQRIALARALLKKPQILILDEATSAVDQLSEKYIIETINNLPKDMLIIIIAHRLSTIRNCDKIFVLKYGTIAESGSHSELLELEGEYSKLYYANA